MRTILSLVEGLDQLDPEATIYATEPWTPESQAIVAIEDTTTGVAKDGMTYFLEIALALEILEDWDKSGLRSTIDRCRRVIEYAQNDA
ncbi:MAG: hypothetical protein ABUL55_02260 [Pseudomonadota bacterium]